MTRSVKTWGAHWVPNTPDQHHPQAHDQQKRSPENRNVTRATQRQEARQTDRGTPYPLPAWPLVAPVPGVFRALESSQTATRYPLLGGLLRAVPAHVTVATSNGLGSLMLT